MEHSTARASATGQGGAIVVSDAQRVWSNPTVMRGGALSSEFVCFFSHFRSSIFHPKHASEETLPAQKATQLSNAIYTALKTTYHSTTRGGHSYQDPSDAQKNDIVKEVYSACLILINYSVPPRYYNMLLPITGSTSP